MYLCLGSSGHALPAAPAGAGRGINGGKAIHCSALEEQGTPWGISTAITREPAHGTSDGGSGSRASAEDASASCWHRHVWVPLWVSVHLRGQEPSARPVLCSERSQRCVFLCVVSDDVCNHVPSCPLSHGAALAPGIIGTPEVGSGARRSAEVSWVKALLGVSTVFTHLLAMSSL